MMSQATASEELFELKLIARLLVRPNAGWQAFGGKWLHRPGNYNPRLPNLALINFFLPTCATVDSLHMKLLLLSHSSPLQQAKILSILQTDYATPSQTQTAKSQQPNNSALLPP